MLFRSIAINSEINIVWTELSFCFMLQVPDVELLDLPLLLFEQEVVPRQYPPSDNAVEAFVACCGLHSLR